MIRAAACAATHAPLPPRKKEPRPEPGFLALPAGRQDQNVMLQLLM
jgi:hypothetical protein